MPSSYIQLRVFSFPIRPGSPGTSTISQYKRRLSRYSRSKYRSIFQYDLGADSCRPPIQMHSRHLTSARGRTICQCCQRHQVAADFASDLFCDLVWPGQSIEQIHPGNHQERRTANAYKFVLRRIEVPFLGAWAAET